MPNFRCRVPTSTDCVTTATSNAGCGVNFPTSFSYGPSFNSVGGGWCVLKRRTSFFTPKILKYRYVMERNEKSIKVWFWARNDPSVPSDIINGASSISPDTWVRHSSISRMPTLTNKSIRESLPGCFLARIAIFRHISSNTTLSSTWHSVRVTISVGSGTNELVLGGDWAGSAYGQSGCPSTCIGEFMNRPEAFDKK